MTALGTPNAPVLSALGAEEATVTWTQVANADTYQIKVYPKAPKTSVDYDLGDAALTVAVKRTPGTGSTTQVVALPSEINSNPTHLFKVSLVAQDSTATFTDSTESAKSNALALKVVAEGNLTEASVVAETINPFTGKAFAFAATNQPHSHTVYTRNGDGTVSQANDDANGVLGTQGAQAGTQKTKARDAGLVTPQKSLASDLKYKLTTPSDPSNGVAVVDPVALTTSTPSNTSEDTAVVGEGSIVTFVDRVAAEVGAADVVYGAGKSF